MVWLERGESTSTRIRNACHGSITKLQTRVFYDRKIGEGKTHKEAIRALKRRISDRVYNHLVADARAAASI